MNKILENCLFLQDKNRFAILRTEASDFRNKYIGDTIVRDSIFDIIQNYAKSNNHEIKILKFPIDDSELWAFTCIHAGIIFVTINTALPLNKQIFATAHELYHIYRYIDEKQNKYTEKGSILTETVFNEEQISDEDREANAFAALILAPKEQIIKQSQLSGKKFTESDFNDLVHFMNDFAMPYKAMVIKLFECDRYTDKEADSLLSTESNSILEMADIQDCGTQWLKSTYENNLDSIQKLIALNYKSNNITTERMNEDSAFLDNLKKQFKKKDI